MDQSKPGSFELPISKLEGTYHHGNLKEALKQCAAKLMLDQGSVQFGMRDIAKLAGVSPGAAYKHFKSKSHLLSALAADGFKSLLEDLKQRLGKSPCSLCEFSEIFYDSLLNFSNKNRTLTATMLRINFSELGPRSDLYLSAKYFLNFCAQFILFTKTKRKGVFRETPELGLNFLFLWTYMQGVMSSNLNEAIPVFTGVSKKDQNLLLKKILIRFTDQNSELQT
jgi:AcrR family transcriptional regulator